jgi:signal transduction histidine kinase
MGSHIEISAVVGQLREWIAWGRAPFLLAVGYYIGAEAAFLVGTLSDRIFAPFWPPNVILFSALVFTPYRRWWVFVAFSLPAHVMAELAVGMDWPQVLVAFTTNCMIAVLNAFGVRYLLGDPPWFDNFHKAILYCAVTALANPAIVAVAGAGVRIAGGGSVNDYWTYWAQWYAANALGWLTLGPVLLTWVEGNRERAEFSSRRRMAEALLLAIALAIASIAAFRVGSWTSRGFLPAMLYLPLPLILWAAVRFRALGASTAVLIVTMASIWLTLNGATVFVGADAEQSVVALQLFLIGLSVPVLLLGATMDGLRRAEHTTAELARFILGAQDEERRQVARDLHDRVAQDLVAASWRCEQIRGALPEREQPAAKQLDDLLQRSMERLRTTSYLLHPPLLDDAGLEAALRALLEDLSHRSGISIALDISPALGRLAPNVELTIFRLVEDALANVRQHSGSATARVSIDRPAVPGRQHIVVEVEDDGKGMPGLSALPELIQENVPLVSARGLGLARMRERLRCIGGKLEIKSGLGGTVVRAVIPVLDPERDKGIAASRMLEPF